MRAKRLANATAIALLALSCMLFATCDDEDEPAGPSDTTAPADIDDLTAGDAGISTLTLWWTAPGDDGETGRASRYEVRSLNGPITNDNWAGAAVVPGVQPPRVAGQAETLLVSSLAPGQTYYFAVRTTDESSNWSNVSNPASLSTIDAIAPDAVFDLAAGNATDSSVTLTWTAPGDDEDIGRAQLYSVRWSLQPITTANWNAATSIPGVPAPQSAGFPEQFVVTGLDPQTTYYFALRTADEVPNISTLSNVASATTLLAAAINEGELLHNLEEIYRSLDSEQFAHLLPTDNQAEYLFILDEPNPDDGATSWGRTVELSVHQRMFDPEGTPVGEDPVPVELWLTNVSITLTPVTSWEERTDLYQPMGTIDPNRWRATDAEYHAVLFFGTQGETDYTVDGRANFVVINDLTKAAGEDRKYLIYRWEDLGQWSITAVEGKTWSGVKSLYKS